MEWRIPVALLLSLLHRLTSGSSIVYDADVVVYSATPAGVAAAIAARLSGAQTVLLLEPTAYVGGMASPGGIGLRDCNVKQVRTNNSTQHEWGMRNAKHYGVSDPVWQPDNWVGEMSFKQMLSHYDVQLHLNTNFKEGSGGVVTEVDEAGLRRITALLLESGHEVKGKYFIDASYEGELMMATGHVTYTYGREGRSEYNESYAGVSSSSLSHFPVPTDPYTTVNDKAQLLNYIQEGPDPRKNVGQPDKNVMAYSFRACITTNPNNSVNYPKPPNYNPQDFELSQRLLLNVIAANGKLQLPWNNLQYMQYPSSVVKADKFDACCGMAPVGIDAVGLAVKYPNASRAQRKEIYDAHKYYVQGLMWFWTHDQSVPEDIRKSMKLYGLCKDEWPENGHFPPQLYVREAVRMVGDKVFTQQDRVPALDPQGCRNDSIAIGVWGLDIHDMQRVAVVDSDTHKHMVFNEGLTASSFGGFYIYEVPYYTLLPRRREMVNLAAPNCPSVTHVTFSAIRVEPTLWQLGQAAGTAAGLAAMNGGTVPLQDVPVGQIQKALIVQKAFIHWPPRDKC